jgi:hypothetical protein
LFSVGKRVNTIYRLDNFTSTWILETQNLKNAASISVTFLTLDTFAECSITPTPPTNGSTTETPPPHPETKGEKQF